MLVLWIAAHVPDLGECFLLDSRYEIGKIVYLRFSCRPICAIPYYMWGDIENGIWKDK